MKKNDKQKAKFVITRNVLSFAIFVMLVIVVSFYVSFSYYTKSSQGTFFKSIATTSDSDVEIKVYLQTTDADGNLTYTRVYFAPDIGYTYNASKTECSDGIEIITTSDGFEVTSGSRGRCKIYYDKDEGTTNDIITNIFVSSDNGNTYKAVAKVPTDGYVYELNSTNTTCTNGASVSLSSNEIEVTSASPTVCNVYLNRTDTITAVQTVIDLNGTDNSDIPWDVKNKYGYRYGGPMYNVAFANYINFNDQLWRIIGAINTEYDANNDGVIDSSGYLLKIAYVLSGDNESLSLDSNNANLSFEQTTLGQYLNSSILTAEAEAKVVNAAWKVATFDITEIQDDTGLKVKEVARREQNGSTIITKVAIPNVTDFLYSVYNDDLWGDGTESAAETDFYNFATYVSSASRPYLFDLYAANYIDVMSIDKVVDATDTTAYYYLNASGGASSAYATYDTQSIIIPTVFLKPGLYFTDGDGTYSNPYILSD